MVLTCLFVDLFGLLEGILANFRLRKMERIHQMKVVPDVLPELHPSIDLHVTVRTSPKELHKTKKTHATVEPGTFLSPEQVRGFQGIVWRVTTCCNQTLSPPKLYANVFHTDTRLYTMLLVDLGALTVLATRI